MIEIDGVEIRDILAAKARAQERAGGDVKDIATEVRDERLAAVAFGHLKELVVLSVAEYNERAAERKLPLLKLEASEGAIGVQSHRGRDFRVMLTVDTITYSRSTDNHRFEEWTLEHPFKDATRAVASRLFDFFLYT